MAADSAVVALSRSAVAKGGVAGTSQRAVSRLAGEARWRALLIHVAATLALLTLLIPFPASAQAAGFAVLAAVAYVPGAALWLRASRLGRLELTSVTAAGAALAAAAMAAAARRPAGAAASLSLTRNAWLIAACCVIAGAVAVRRLIVELRHRVHLLDVLARTDQLTGVANRRAWEEELPRELGRARRDGSQVCVALFDLDRFKAYNDMRGHQEGDSLLHRVATAWRESLRESDFVARYGGEEFGVILRGCSLEQGLAIVERLRLVVPDAQTCSAGLVRWNGRESAENLVGRADEALYQAKAAGRNRVKVAVYGAGGGDAVPPTSWPAIVREVLEARNMAAVYQPVVRITTGEVVAFEALARPGGRVDISVDRMFSSAQRMGLARDLDWLCRRAALSGARWLPAGRVLFLNVSVSALVDPVHRVDQMMLVLEAVGRGPDEVVLEITEREMVDDLRALRQVVNTYRREGFRFAVDDVGEGHSTLEVLASVEPEFIKIARSLVAQAATRGPRAAIRALVAFAGEIGAEVIAEGIERPQTAAAMLGLGVTLGQGYLYGRPSAPQTFIPVPEAVA